MAILKPHLMCLLRIVARVSMKAWQKSYKEVPLLMMGVCFSVKQNVKNLLSVTLNLMKFYYLLSVVVSI